MIIDAIPVRYKTPTAILDFGRSYIKWLNGDTIQSSTWAVPAGITQVSVSNDTTSTVIFVSGGTLHRTYRLANTITTVGGRSETFSIDVLIVAFKG